ncbi:MAG: 30S ribosomal protein S9 [Clostridia bacterium]|nr:30S ribosomal protein S9 [Clostridia bacterium]
MPRVKKEEAVFLGTGRRKTSVARVRIMPGKGSFVINGKEINDYLNTDVLRTIANQAYAVSGTEGKFDTIVKVEGGGLSGQAGAIRHGIARALVKADEANKPAIKAAGLLTRDPRMKERKKPGLKKARKAPQFSKR